MLNYLNLIHDFRPHMSSMNHANWVLVATHLTPSSHHSSCVSSHLVLIHVHCFAWEWISPTAMFILCNFVFGFAFCWLKLFSSRSSICTRFFWMWFHFVVHVLMLVDFQEFFSLCFSIEDPCWGWMILLIPCTRDHCAMEWTIFTFFFLVVYLSSCYLGSCFHLQFCRSSVLQN
jgi:hypothetical protein